MKNFDIFAGTVDAEVMEEIMNLVRKNKGAITKIGENTMVDFKKPEEISCYFTFKRRYIFLIKTPWSTKELFATNDTKKVKQFNAIKKMNELKRENSINWELDNLNGLLFKSERERNKLAKAVMVLPQ